MLKIWCKLFYFECLLLLRHSQEWLYPLAFFIILIALMPIALTPDSLQLQKIIPGGIWLAALLASLLAVGNLFTHDLEDGYLEQLYLSPYPLTLSLSAKIFAHWIATQLPLIIMTPFISLLFNLSWQVTGTLCLSLLLGTPILILLGSLGIALTLPLRQQGVLLSLLILPLTIPVLIFAIGITREVSIHTITGPLAFLAGLMILAVLFLPITIAATLRMNNHPSD